MQFEDTEINLWFERDRAWVELREISTQKTLVEFWDGDVGEAVADGFLSPKDWHGSAWDYYVLMGGTQPRSP